MMRNGNILLICKGFPALMIMKLAMLTRKLLKSSFLLGVASVFCPTTLTLSQINAQRKAVSDNSLIAKSWAQVGDVMSAALGQDYMTYNGKRRH